MKEDKMCHIIDADKLLKFIEDGMFNSKLCANIEPINSKRLI